MFLAIGDGREEAGAAKLMGWPFLQINLPTPPGPSQEAASLPNGCAAAVSIQHSSTAIISTAATLRPRAAGASHSPAESPDLSFPTSSPALLDAVLQAPSLSAAEMHDASASHCKTLDGGHAAESNLSEADPCGKSTFAVGAEVLGSALHLLQPVDLIQLALQG